VAADARSGLSALLPVLEQAADPVRNDILSGMLDALRGRKQVPRPEGWADAFEKLLASHDQEVVEQTLLLALDIGEQKAIKTLRIIVSDRGSPSGPRLRALTALVERHTPGLTGALYALLDDQAMRGSAIRALAAYNDMATPQRLLSRYASLSDSEREDVIATLSARPAWALDLLDAVGNKTIPRGDLNATIARQLLALGDERVRARLQDVWGTIRQTSKEKSSLITKYKNLLSSDQLPAADTSRGRLVFKRTCNQCHKLFDSGGDVGPDLTGSDRANADYILENVLDPSAAVAREYTLANVATTEGRLVSGIIREQNDRSITIQTANERIILPREDVEEIKPSGVSMMPEGQLERLSPQEVRDLFAYLAASRQVTLPNDTP
jgi:putative heme-binding domain-containing protein